MDLKYTPEESEILWAKRWEESGIYRWEPGSLRDDTFVVDTPPPTVSGSLHIGHVFSYTQTDLLVRYQRMRGKSIFYPIGWDDNGLPTERRVQNYFHIRCDPGVPYRPDWKPVRPEKDDGPPESVSRENFIEACILLTAEDEAAFERLFRRIGQSYDWRLQYSTIDKDCRALSQFSFLDLIKKGFVYSSDAPAMYDTSFRTAVSQAEAEDREVTGTFHDIAFGIEGGGELVIATTRPELLPACVAVVAHPDDPRYQPYFGKRAITPLFHAPVPIQPAPYADPSKGTGILMVCTFGDIMDVYWWKEQKLPLRQVIGADGKITPQQFGAGAFESLQPGRAQSAYEQLIGLPAKAARKKVVELLAQEGSHPSGSGSALRGEPKQIKHPVKFYEKGDQPLEFIPTRQWFINILDHKAALLEQGRKVLWHPSHMLTRYEHWVEGLNQDWCISRQRFFGVPFPVWYPVGDNGAPDFNRPIYADGNHLPIDPQTDCPPGYQPGQRGQPGGFVGDPDVMDTWATSSLTPQIKSGWLQDQERHKHLFPSDLRPQAHDIIRTWAFYTVVKAWMHEGAIPWRHIAVSGFIVDPDRKKMSKSKGNVITPEGLIQEHSADAVRYWASRGRLGIDTAFEPTMFKLGRKLTTKMYNASRFALGHFDRVASSPRSCSVRDISEPLDRAMAAELCKVVENATAAFDKFDYAAALQHTEDFFWPYCDHYLELVKVRSYRENDCRERRSALAALSWSLKTFLRLFAPIVPFVTEDLWSTSFAGEGREHSVHTAPWPAADEVREVVPPESYESGSRVLAAAIEVIGKIRGAKTEARKNLRWKVASLEVCGEKKNLDDLAPVLSDVLAAGNVVPGGFKAQESAPPESGMFRVSVTLSDSEG